MKRIDQDFGEKKKLVQSPEDFSNFLKDVLALNLFK